MGRCPGCGEWNCIEEKRLAPVRATEPGAGEDDQAGRIVSLAELKSETQTRTRTGINELDRVLGGGLVRRSVILVGGDPGIGKSTLLMQALGRMARSGESVLYVSGEESAEQLRLRAERLDVAADGFLVFVENQLDSIITTMQSCQASAIVLDSVQSVNGGSPESQAGSLSQVRQVAARVIDCVKRGSAACFVVGHVTKEGALAGPKALEHMVDTVLYFEGERGHPYRILRAVKNRFGSVSEIGVFEMGDSGLVEVPNPSEIFLSERPEGAAGSAVTALVEGTRPILAEIQALVSGPVPGPGRRTCLGIDTQRLALMIAVMDKKLGLSLADHDVFLNAVGGIRAGEPAVDLALVAALLSSFTDRVVAAGTLVFGEVGLAGEVRRVSRSGERVHEAARLGFGRIVMPRSSVESVSVPRGIVVEGISHVKELAPLIFTR